MPSSSRLCHCFIFYFLRKQDVPGVYVLRGMHVCMCQIDVLVGPLRRKVEKYWSKQMGKMYVRGEDENTYQISSREDVERLLGVYMIIFFLFFAADSGTFRGARSYIGRV